MPHNLKMLITFSGTNRKKISMFSLKPKLDDVLKKRVYLHIYLPGKRVYSFGFVD